MNDQLSDRLVPVANQLKASIEKGAQEAHSRGQFYTGQAVVLKSKYWLESLAELLSIHAKYSSKQDLDQINQFIEIEKTKLTSTFSRHGFTDDYDKLDTGIKDLKILLKDQSPGGKGVDDLRNKTDDELKDIMRDSINNAYVPSSIYHKAKQELEFRSTRPNQAIEQNFHGSVGTVGINNGTSIADQHPSPVIRQKLWKEPLLLTILGFLGTIVAGYILYKLGWN